MIEQELASVIRFVLDNAGDVYPYYWNVPESFRYPAVYFPVPEAVTGGETMLTYNVDFTLYVKFFSATTQEAYGTGLNVVNAVRADRNLVPLVNEDGETLKEGIRVRDPALKVLDDGAAQMSVSWRSRRPYNGVEAEKMMKFVVNWKYRTGDGMSAVENLEG